MPNLTWVRDANPPQEVMDAYPFWKYTDSVGVVWMATVEDGAPVYWTWGPRLEWLRGVIR